MLAKQSHNKPLQQQQQQQQQAWTQFPRPCRHFASSTLASRLPDTSLHQSDARCRAVAEEQQQQQQQQDGVGPATAPGGTVFQGQQLQPGTDPQQLLGTLSAIKTYQQLSAFVQSQQEVFLHTPLCVYALLHAVQLRDTLSSGGRGDDEGDSSRSSSSSRSAAPADDDAKAVQQYELVESLLAQLCGAAAQHAPSLPLISQATLALALAQLGFYHEPLMLAIAGSVKQQLAQTAPPLGPGDAASDGGSGSDGSGSGSSGRPAKATVLTELEEAGLVPGVLLSLLVGCSLNGHYDAQLLDLLAQQAVAFADAFPDASPLISIAAALLDLQHDCPALLLAAARAAEAQEGALQPEEVVTLLLALGFFRVAAPGFCGLALEALAESAGELLEELDPQQLGRLWKALLLLSGEGVEAPPQLVQMLQYVDEQQQEEQQQQQEQKQQGQQQQQEPLILLGASNGALLALADPEGLAEAPEPLRQQWDACGLLAAVDALRGLQQQQGCELQQGVRVAAGPAAEQQQQEEEEEEELQLPPAVVDASFLLPDQRRVAVVLLFQDSYCNHPTNRLRGAAAVDLLVLQALGLVVLPLPVAEWQALAGNAAQQQRYLQARLAAAVG